MRMEAVNKEIEAIKAESYRGISIVQYGDVPMSLYSHRLGPRGVATKSPLAPTHPQLE